MEGIDAQDVDPFHRILPSGSRPRRRGLATARHRHVPRNPAPTTKNGGPAEAGPPWCPWPVGGTRSERVVRVVRVLQVVQAGWTQKSMPPMPPMPPWS